MTRNRGAEGAKGQAASVLKKLLGNLELEIMEFMWQVEEATVRQAVEAINRRRPIAYTTVMTVMGHLVDKGLLARITEGKRYRYRLVWSRGEFLRETSRGMVRSLVADFGDLAIAGFLGEMGGVDPDRLERLRSLVQEAGGESSRSE